VGGAEGVGKEEKRPVPVRLTLGEVGRSERGKTFQRGGGGGGPQVGGG